MIDEWGDELDKIKDEGVFAESALGGFPNTMTGQFPYAGQVTQNIQQVGDNKYAMFKGDQPQGGIPVQAAFPGGAVMPIGMGQAPVRQATAGMGSGEWDIDAAIAAGYTGATPGAAASAVPESAYTSQYGGQTNWSQITGAISGGLSTVMDAVVTGFTIANQQEQHDLQMDAARQQLDQQMQLFQQQLSSGGTNAQLEALLAQAQQASQSGNLEQMLTVLQQLESARRWWVPWAVGGVAVIAVGGVIYWLAAKE